MVWLAVLTGVLLFLQVLCYLMLIYFVLGWFLRSDNRLMRLMSRMAEPPLQPIRRLLGRIFPAMPFDLAPLAMILLLQLLSGLVSSLTRVF
ncbi:MAG TPA: YggT family protein [Clostridia bacterium]|nr:YggT family protein [Clostridia bacterium]